MTIFEKNYYLAFNFFWFRVKISIQKVIGSFFVRVIVAKNHNFIVIFTFLAWKLPKKKKSRLVTPQFFSCFGVYITYTSFSCVFREFLVFFIILPNLLKFTHNLICSHIFAATATCYVMLWFYGLWLWMVWYGMV